MYEEVSEIFERYNEEELQSVCRICFRKSSKLKHLFVVDRNTGTTSAELINFSLKIKIEEDQNFPNCICNQCEAELYFTCDFREKIVKGNEYLQKRLQYFDFDSSCYEVAGNKNDTDVSNETITENTMAKGHSKSNGSLGENESEEAPDSSTDDNIIDVKNARKNKSIKFKHRCLVCNKNFRYKLEMMRHKLNLGHYKIKHVWCRYCRLNVPSSSYKDHMLNKHQFRCKYCNKKISSFYNLKRHLRVHTQERPYYCNTCGKSFSRRDNFSKHWQNCGNEESDLTCLQCNLSFADTEQLQLHSTACSGNPADYRDNYRRSFRCGVCRLMFASKASLEEHEVAHTDDGVLCYVCGNTFASERLLKQHIEKVHMRKNEKRYLCNICPKRYSSTTVLKRHILMHNGIKSFKCKFCGKTFTQSGSLSIHLRIHTDERPFICDVCSKAFRSSGGLQRHLRIHDNSKPYVCGVCDKAFREKYSLMGHMRIHTGEQPFECVKCYRKFTDRSTFSKHRKICKAKELENVF